MGLEYDADTGGRVEPDDELVRLGMATVEDAEAEFGWTFEHESQLGLGGGEQLAGADADTGTTRGCRRGLEPAAGEVCIFTIRAADVALDITGYVT